MSRIYIGLSIVIAGLLSCGNNLCYASGMTCKRYDVQSQRLKWMSSSAFAASTSNPTDIDADNTRTVTDNVTASYAPGATASSGGSYANVDSTLLVTDPTASGTTGISLAEVELSIGTAMLAQVDPGDNAADAYAVLEFGTSGSPCRAYGEFQANSGSATGTFTGELDIIFTWTPSGDAFVFDGKWAVQCGANGVGGVLNATADGWDITGGIYVNGVYQDMTGEVWPLEINTVLTPTQPWTLNDTFELRADAWEFDLEAHADPNTPTSGMTAALSLTAAASIQ